MSARYTDHYYTETRYEDVFEDTEDGLIETVVSASATEFSSVEKDSFVLVRLQYFMSELDSVSGNIQCKLK